MRLLVIAMFFLGSLSYAKTDPSYTDNQEELRQAFERAQSAHHLKMMSSTFSRPTQTSKQSSDVTSQNKTVQTFLEPVPTVKKVQDYIRFDILQKYGISDFAKRMWRTVKGIKSLPPTATNFFFTFNTAGLAPEVMWFVQGATDPDGYVDRYEFTFGDGTTQVVPYDDFDHTLQAINHIYPTNGTYNASVKIVDDTGDYTTYNASVTVTSTNVAPVPKFTVQTNQVPNFLKVDFTSQATDANGTLIRYLWGFGDGSADNIGTTNTSVSHTYTNPGTYSVRFQARDNTRAQVTVNTQIYVGVTPPAGGIPPIPIVKANRLAGLAPMTVNFDGESSFDIDGTIASYEWNFGEFASPLNISYESKPTYRYTQPGTYYGSLKTTDNGGRSTTRYFAAYVIKSGTPATALITAYPQQQARTFLFETSFKNLRAAVPSSYIIWDFGDGSPRQKKNYPTYTYASDGTYTVTMKIYDVRGGYQSVQKEIIVSADQSAPTSYFIADQSNTEVSTSVNFITQNQNLVAPTSTAIWDFGDGTIQSGFHEDLLTVNHTYSQSGIYPVSLLVTDADGKSSQSFNYVVVQVTGSPVQARIITSQKIGPIPFPVRVDATSSSSSAGTIDKYRWALYSSGSTFYSQSPVWTPTFTTGGEKVFRLFATDSAGNTALAFERVSALDYTQIPPGNLPPVPMINISFYDPNDPGAFKFDAYSSSDPEGDRIINYEWNLNGSKIDGYLDAHINIPDVGTHTITLKVTDRWGASAELKKKFSRGVDTEEMITFLRTPDRATVNTKVFFLADEETVLIPGAAAKEYRWNFGDGKVDCCVGRVNHMYSAPGTYTVTLTILDTNNETHTYSENVVVESSAAPTVVITATDSGNTVEYHGNQTYVSDIFPASIEFDALKRSSAQGGNLAYATWDFGDGNTGFGLKPNYVYQKPGLYTVEVTGYDQQGLSNTSTMQVRVDSLYCSDTDGIEGCLNLKNSLGSTLPMSASEWIIGHDAGTQEWDPHVSDTDYAELITADNGTEVRYNITDSIVVDGEDLKIQKSDLQTMGVNFLRPYRLVIQTTLDDATEYAGMFPKFNFGVGTLNITTNESGIQLVVSGPDGYRKFVDLGGGTTHQLSNLPSGGYYIIAKKGSKHLGYNVTITSATPQSLSVDLSLASVTRHKRAMEKEALERKSSWSKDLNVQRILNPSFKENKSTPRSYPPWTYDSCGNHAPFPLAVDRRPADPGKIYDHHFGTWDPERQKDFFRVSRHFNRKMGLRCSMAVNINHYPVTSWVHETGPIRCGFSSQPNHYWYVYQSYIDTDSNRTVKIQYTLRDKASGRQITEVKSFNALTLMSEMGLTKNNITNTLGIAYRTDIDHWGLKFNWDINVPSDYKRPEASFEIEGHYNPIIGDRTFAVYCDFEKPIDERPRVDSIQVSPEGSDVLHTPAYNGKRLVGESKGGNFFPADSDTLAETKMSNIFEAKVKLNFKKGSYLSSHFTGAKVTLLKDGEPVGSPKTYNFVDGSVVDDDVYGQDLFSGDIIIESKNFDGDIEYVSGQSPILGFKILPVVDGLLDHEVGEKTVGGIIPLFNLKKVNSGGNSVCANGFYNESRTISFAQSKLIGALSAVTANTDVNFKCNDASLPWGGAYKGIPNSSGWSHLGHNDGLRIDVRYFNTSGTTQDSYDANEATQRLSDLNEYLQFSSWAKFIAGAADADVVKIAVHNLCVSNAANGPCSLFTPVSALTHEMVLKTCQWYGTSEMVCNPSSPSLVKWPQAIERYSNWAKINMEALNTLKTFPLSPLMAGGSDGRVFTPIVGLPIYNSNWQRIAVNEGRWPDGFQIYQVNSGTIQNTGINTCGGNCSIAGFEDGIDDHFDHIHFDYR